MSIREISFDGSANVKAYVNIVAVGDSITDHHWTEYLEAALPDAVATPDGTGGADLDIISLSVYSAAPDPNASENIMILWGGSNDLAEGRSPEEAFEKLQYLVDYASASGFTVWAPTALDRFDVGAATADGIDAYNDYLRTSLENAVVIDMAAAYDAYPGASALYQDKVHPNDAGYAYIAETFLDYADALGLTGALAAAG